MSYYTNSFYNSTCDGENFYPTIGCNGHIKLFHENSRRFTETQPVISYSSNLRYDYHSMNYAASNSSARASQSYRESTTGTGSQIKRFSCPNGPRTPPPSFKRKSEYPLINDGNKRKTSSDLRCSDYSVGRLENESSSHLHLPPTPPPPGSPPRHLPQPILKRGKSQGKDYLRYEKFRCPNGPRTPPLSFKRKSEYPLITGDLTGDYKRQTYSDLRCSDFSMRRLENESSSHLHLPPPPPPPGSPPRHLPQPVPKRGKSQGKEDYLR